jgi:hypothetical protein
MPVAIENRSEANSPHRRLQPAFLGFVFARERLLTVVKVCSSSFLSPSQNSNFHSPSTSPVGWAERSEAQQELK